MLHVPANQCAKLVKLVLVYKAINVILALQELSWKVKPAKHAQIPVKHAQAILCAKSVRLEMDCKAINVLLVPLMLILAAKLA